MRAKAIPNNFLDYHPKFVKNGGRWEVFIVYFFLFFFSDSFKNRTLLKEEFNTCRN